MLVFLANVEVRDLNTRRRFMCIHEEERTKSVARLVGFMPCLEEARMRLF